MGHTFWCDQTWTKNKPFTSDFPSELGLHFQFIVHSNVSLPEGICEIILAARFDDMGVSENDYKTTQMATLMGI